MIFVNLPCNKIFSDHPSRKVSQEIDAVFMLRMVHICEKSHAGPVTFELNFL